jgi:HAD superfamily hydrolase (TIGR01509 family)
MNIKYIIFDFGKVLGYPKSGKWFLTPKFITILNESKIELEKAKEAISNNKYLVKDDLPIKTLEEEYNLFISFYSNILDELGLDKELAKEIAYDKVYNISEYSLYDDVKDILNKLNKNYKLIMLTNNYPSIVDYLKKEEVYDLFDKVYVSSICETSKNEEKFFDMVINDYNISENEAIFIDDFEDNLDIGYKKKLDVIMLDRNNKKESKYKKINSLKELEEYITSN